MVRGSISDAERRVWNRVIGIGFVGTVGGSAGLMAFANGASLAVTAGLAAFGLLTGLGLVLYLSSISVANRPGREFRER